MKRTTITIIATSLFCCNTKKSIKPDYEVNKNETFEISLKANATTGYSWKWIKNQSSKLLDSVNSTYIPTKVKEGIVGSGGNEIWKFRAIESGIDTLKFEYQRSWESRSAIESKKIIVKIK